MPISKRYANYDLNRAHHVFSHVTGLSLHELSRYGKPYLPVLQTVIGLCEQWNVECVFARDIRLEQRFFKTLHLKEICDHLLEPYRSSYMLKSGRPVDEYNAHYVMCNCGHHQFVKVPSSPIYVYAHCARVDAYIMFSWLIHAANLSSL